MAQEQKAATAAKAVATATSEENTTPVPAPQAITMTTEMLMQFAAAIGKSVADGVKAAAPVRRKSFNEVAPSSVFNPEGKRNRALKRSMVINGLPGETLIESLTDGEIECLDQLQPGRYLDGLYTVVERYDGPKQIIYLWYANRTNAQQNALNKFGLTFEDRLRAALAEQAAKAVPSLAAS